MASTQGSAGAQNNAKSEPIATTTATRSKGVRPPPPHYEDIDQYRRTSQAARRHTDGATDPKLNLDQNKGSSGTPRSAPDREVVARARKSRSAYSSTNTWGRGPAEGTETCKHAAKEGEQCDYSTRGFTPSEWRGGSLHKGDVDACLVDSKARGARRPLPPTYQEACRISASTTKKTYAPGARSTTTMPDVNSNSNKPEATQRPLARDGKAGSTENVKRRPRKGKTDGAVGEDECVFNSKVKARGRNGGPDKVGAVERTTTTRRSKSEKFKRPQNLERLRSNSVTRGDRLAVERANAFWNTVYRVSDEGATRGDSTVVHIEPRRHCEFTGTTESGAEDAGAKGRERRWSRQTSASEEEDGGTGISTEAVYNFETMLRTEAMYEDACKNQINRQPTARTLWSRLGHQTSASEEEDGGTVISTEAVYNFEAVLRTEALYEDAYKGQINRQPTARTLWSRLCHQTSASEEEDGGTVISTEAVYNFETVLRTEALYEDAYKGQVNRQPTTRTLWPVSEDDGTAEGTVEDTIDSTDAVYNFDAYLSNKVLTTVVQPVFCSGVVRDLRALLELIEIATTPSFEEQYNQDA